MSTALNCEGLLGIAGSALEAGKVITALFEMDGGNYLPEHDVSMSRFDDVIFYRKSRFRVCVEGIGEVVLFEGASQVGW